MQFRTFLAGACLPLFLLPPLAAAEQYHATELQLFHTWKARPDAVNGTGTRDNKLQSFRLMHYGTFAYGDNCFFVDNYHGKDVGAPGVDNQQYMAYMPRISLGKLLGKDLSFGIVRDISLGARVEYASYGNFNAKGFGPSVDLALPGFDWMQVRLFTQDTNFDRRTVYLHDAWASRFNVGGARLLFEGYFWTRKQDNGSRQWFAEPDLTVALDPQGKLQAGARLTYAGYQGYSRLTPQVILKWKF